MLECALRYGIAYTPGLRSLDETVDLPWTDSEPHGPVSRQRPKDARRPDDLLAGIATGNKTLINNTLTV
jgi:hypothetical protein